MTTVGQQLRLERERRGLKRVDVARATKIGAHHLAALEHDDFAALPDTVFAKGFLRSYAQHLGLDVERVLAEFASALDVERPASAPEERPEVVRQMSQILLKHDKRRLPPRGVLLALGAGTVLVVLLLLAWNRPAPEAPPAQAERLGPEPSVSHPVPPPPAEPAPSHAVPAVSTPTAPAVEHAPTRQPSADPSLATAAAPTRPAPPSRLTVPEHGVGTGVAARALVGRADRFSEGTDVWFWTRVLGGRSGEVVRHVWLQDGREVKRVELELGGSHWRTQSRKPLEHGSAGPWSVEARDGSGVVLARDEFLCTAE